MSLNMLELTEPERDKECEVHISLKVPVSKDKASFTMASNGKYVDQDIDCKGKEQLIRNFLANKPSIDYIVGLDFHTCWSDDKLIELLHMIEHFENSDYLRVEMETIDKKATLDNMIEKAKQWLVIWNEIIRRHPRECKLGGNYIKIAYKPEHCTIKLNAGWDSYKNIITKATEEQKANIIDSIFKKFGDKEEETEPLKAFSMCK